MTACIAELIPQSPASDSLNISDPYADDTSRECCALLNWCVSGVSVVEVPVCIYLRSNCNHVTAKGGP
jgi:hypothetical protein